MSSLTDRFALPERAPGHFGPSPPEPTAGAGSAQAGWKVAANESLDPDTLEVVHQFEALYAELTPPVAEAPQDDGINVDDLLIDLPDGGAKGPLHSNRPSGPQVAGKHAPAPRTERPPPALHPLNPRRPQSDEADVSLDDAMTLLRAAEAQGRSAAKHAERKALDEENDRREAAESRGSSERLMKPVTERSMPHAGVPAVAVESWSARSGTLWSRVVVAATIALAVGAGVGYIVAKGHDSVGASAKIATTPQGGAQLRVEYELRKR